ncbi:MAG: hypothetical protein ACI9EW_002887, partial [Cellvibrionaceae bacterium]
MSFLFTKMARPYINGVIYGASHPLRGDIASTMNHTEPH